MEQCKKKLSEVYTESAHWWLDAYIRGARSIKCVERLQELKWLDDSDQPRIDELKTKVEQDKEMIISSADKAIDALEREADYG